MKKFLVSLLLLYPSITYAEKNFYLKLDIAGNNVIFFKQHSKISPEINVGAGYYFNDFYRIDLAVGHANFSADDRYMSYEETANDSSSSGTRSIVYKTQAQYVMLNQYVNIIRNDNFQVYVSGGIGFGKIKENITRFFSGLLINGNVITIPLTTEHYVSKSTKHFIYSLGIGASTKINSGVNLDIAYNYKDLGNPVYKLNTLPTTLSIKKYRVHNLSVGIRFDL